MKRPQEPLRGFGTEPFLDVNDGKATKRGDYREGKLVAEMLNVFMLANFKES